MELRTGSPQVMARAEWKWGKVPDALSSVSSVQPTSSPSIALSFSAPASVRRPGRFTFSTSTVAGVARQGEVVYGPLGPAAEFDHFTDTSKMVLRELPGVRACFTRAFDDLLEVLPIGITEHRLKLAGAPALHLVQGATGRLEALPEFVDEFLLHVPLAIDGSIVDRRSTVYDLRGLAMVRVEKYLAMGRQLFTWLHGDPFSRLPLRSLTRAFRKSRRPSRNHAPYKPSPRCCNTSAVMGRLLCAQKPGT